MHLNTTFEAAVAAISPISARRQDRYMQYSKTQVESRERDLSPITLQTTQIWNQIIVV